MALGYEGYPALRRQLRELAGDAPESSAEGNAMQLAVRGEAEHLARLHDQLARLDDVERAAGLLVASRPLPVLGLGAGGPLAGSSGGPEGGGEGKGGGWGWGRYRTKKKGGAG